MEWWRGSRWDVRGRFVAWDAGGFYRVKGGEL